MIERKLVSMELGTEDPQGQVKETDRLEKQLAEGVQLVKYMTAVFDEIWGILGKTSEETNDLDIQELPAAVAAIKADRDGLKADVVSTSQLIATLCSQLLIYKRKGGYLPPDIRAIVLGYEERVEKKGKIH